MTFPVSYRPIKFIKDAPYMNFRNKDKTYPYIVNHVERLLRKHNDTRGIIHTHTNEITSYIKENLKSSRLLFKEDFDGDATAVIEEHKKQSNSVLVSPSMHEGLDLTDDLGRFQIICKMPFPNRADKRIQKIIVGKFGENYYNWLANLKLYQSLGRINRHETDFGVSYVLDACAQKRLCSGPDYIKEALEDE
jgi:Rad3-related DNA helicase